jgi:hypothetical protein
MGDLSPDHLPNLAPDHTVGMILGVVNPLL